MYMIAGCVQQPAPTDQCGCAVGCPTCTVTGANGNGNVISFGGAGGTMPVIVTEGPGGGVVSTQPIDWMGGPGPVIVTDPMPPMIEEPPMMSGMNTACTTCIERPGMFYHQDGSCQRTSAADGTVTCSSLGQSVLTSVTTQYGGSTMQQSMMCCEHMISAATNNGVSTMSTCDVSLLTTACADVAMTDMSFCNSQCHTVAVAMLPACKTASPDLATVVQAFLGNCDGH
jgi:hypothetical protein